MNLRIILLAALTGLAAPAQAQAPDTTGTGGGPSSTIRAPNTTAVGQTKPPGSAAGPATPEERDRFEQIEKKNNSIPSGICIGCDK